jgi:hypothetical protein
MKRGEAFAEWCIVEMLGHRRLAGFLSEQEIAGAGFLRLEIPAPEGGFAATQFIAPASIYCITPTSEATARAFAVGNQPAPVQRWELNALPEVARDEAEDHSLLADAFADDEDDP